MPIRSLFRDGGGVDPAERVLPNHLGNVRVLTLDLLELRLHHAHLVCRLLLEKKNRADRLVVALVADVDDGVPLASADADFVVDLGDEGADGVDHTAPSDPGG